MSNKESHHSTSKKLGCQLIADGKYKEAEPIFRVLADCRSDVLGNGDEETASAYQMLAFVLEKQGKYKEALQQYDKALKAYEEAYEGEGHPEADFVYASMVKVYRTTKQFDKALGTSKRLLEIRLKDLGDAHPKTALSYHNVAICLYDQGNHKEALDTLNKALQVQQCAGDGDTHGIAAIYTTMAKILVEQDRFDKALLIYKRVLTHQVKVLGQYSPAVALTYRNMALALQSQSKTVEAWKACVNSLQIQNKLMEDKDPNASWRKQCQKDTGSPDVLRAEAKKTLQITQILEKQMARTMVQSQLTTTTAAAAAPTTDATTPAAIGKPTTDPNVTPKRKSPNAATSNVTKKRKLTKKLPPMENSEGDKGLSYRTQEPVTKMHSKQQVFNHLVSQPTTNAAAALTTEATATTTTGTALATEVCTATTRTTEATIAATGNDCDPTLPKFTQKRKLARKLREIEGLEEKGLFNLTQEEITKLKSKQQILDRLAFLQRLEDTTRVDAVLPTGTKETPPKTRKFPSKQMAIASKLPSQQITTPAVASPTNKDTPANDNLAHVTQQPKLAKELRQTESPEKMEMEVDKENDTRPPAVAAESEYYQAIQKPTKKSKSLRRPMRRKSMKKRTESRNENDGNQSDENAIVKLPPQQPTTGAAKVAPKASTTASISLKPFPSCPSRELAFSNDEVSRRYSSSSSMAFSDRLGSLREEEESSSSFSSSDMVDPNAKVGKLRPTKALESKGVLI